MSAFKVGDLCVGQNLVNEIEYNGVDCVIIEGLHFSAFHSEISGVRGNAWGYMVRWADGDETFQQPHELRLKRPPSKDDAEPLTDFTPSSWDVGPFNPYKQKVTP
jgi:hypothetical protein